MAHDVEVFVGNVDDATKHNGLIGADLDLRPVRRIRISGRVNLLFQLAESANSIGGAQVCPFALALIVQECCIEVSQVFPPQPLRLVWVVLDSEKRVIVVRIFRLAFAELDDAERIVGIRTDVRLVDQLKDGRLAKILVVLSYVFKTEMTAFGI
jgi:hypothetical protein